MNFIQTLLEMTEELECPKIYMKWSALSTISAIKKRDVYVDRYGGAYRLYPNIFVLLLGPSGSIKSFAISVADKLVTSIENTRVLAGRGTIEELMTNLSKTTSQNGKPPLVDAHGSIFSEEFGAAIVANPAAFTILTELYSLYKPKYEYRTKKDSTIILKNPYLTIFGGLTPANFDDLLGEKDLKGGFIGRFFLPEFTEYRVINAGVSSPKVKIDYESLTKRLKEIAEVKGGFSFTPAAKDLFENFHKTNRLLIQSKDVEDTTGSYARISDSALKLAMLYSLSETSSLVFEEHHIQEAIDTCQDNASRIQRTTFVAPEKDEKLAQKLKKIMVVVYDSPDHTITRKQLANRVYRFCQSMELTGILETLKEGKILDEKHEGGEVIYKMNPNVTSSFNKQLGK